MSVSASAQSPPPAATASTSAPGTESDSLPNSAATVESADTVEAPALPNAQARTSPAEPTPAAAVPPAVTPASNDDYFFPEKPDPRWKFSASRLILGAENLSGIERFERTTYNRNGDKTGEASGTDFRFLYPGSGVRLSGDYARGATIGGSIGFLSSPVTYSEPNGLESRSSSNSYEVGLRGGVLLGSDNPAFCIWLRAGYEYRVYTTRESQQNPKLGTSYHLFGLDPRLLFALAPHVSLAVGPYLTAAFGTSEIDDVKIATHRVLVGGVTMSLYAFIGG